MKRWNKRNWKGGRTSRGGYVLRHAPSHPHANGGGYVAEHRLVAEQALGRVIPRKSPVHHVNGDKSDNRPCNLVVCEDNAYHRLLHMRQNALDACGNPDWRMCYYCREYSPAAELVNQSSGWRLHPACVRLYHAYTRGGEDHVERVRQFMAAKPPEVEVMRDCPTCKGTGKVVAGPQPPTPKQARVLQAIQDLTRANNGIPPTYREIADHVGLSSIGTVAEHIDTLQEKGYVFRDPHLTNTVRIIRKDAA